MFDRSIEELLVEVENRKLKTSTRFYCKFNKKESNKLRSYYKDQLTIPLGPSDLGIYSPTGLLLSEGYDRIAIGDYGAYIECSFEKVIKENVRNKFPYNNAIVKYIWMVPRDYSSVKIYYQQGTVSYADYKVGMFYFDPREVVLK